MQSSYRDVESGRFERRNHEGIACGSYGDAVVVEGSIDDEAWLVVFFICVDQARCDLELNMGWMSFI